MCRELTWWPVNVGLDCFLFKDSEFGDKHMEFGTGVVGKRTTSAAVEVDAAGSWKRPNAPDLVTEIIVKHSGFKFKIVLRNFQHCKTRKNVDGIRRNLSKRMEGFTSKIFFSKLIFLFVNKFRLTNETL